MEYESPIPIRIFGLLFLSHGGKNPLLSLCFRQYDKNKGIRMQMQASHPWVWHQASCWAAVVKRPLHVKEVTLFFINPFNSHPCLPHHASDPYCVCTLDFFCFISGLPRSQLFLPQGQPYVLFPMSGCLPFTPHLANSSVSWFEGLFSRKGCSLNPFSYRWISLVLALRASHVFPLSHLPQCI